MKFLLWFVIVLVILLVLRKAQGPRARRQPPPRAAETMVVCAYCGVNQPRSESLLVDGRYYCCTQHQRAARQAND